MEKDSLGTPLGGKQPRLESGQTQNIAEHIRISSDKECHFKLCNHFQETGNVRRHPGEGS